MEDPPPNQPHKTWQNNVVCTKTDLEGFWKAELYPHRRDRGALKSGVHKAFTDKHHGILTWERPKRLYKIPLYSTKYSIFCGFTK